MYTTKTKDEIKVVGIELKTSNQNGQATKEIPLFWQKFYAQNIKDQIPNKIDNEVLGLYIDYEGDFTAPYSFVICYKVSNLENIPQGMVGKTIPSSNYAVFTATGKFPENILETWQKIWKSDLNRTYSGDFEVYEQDFSATQNPEVNVYISIK